MKTISAADANRHFSKLLRDVQAGETITITSRGTPVATIRPAGDQISEQERKQQAIRELLDHLKERPVRNLGQFSRDELYDGDE